MHSATNLEQRQEPYIAAWMCPLGLCFAVLAIGGFITCLHAAAVFRCLVAATAAVDPSPMASSTILVALQAVVWCEAVLLLASISAAMAWTAVVLLHPVLSLHPAVYSAIDNQPIIHRLAHLVETSWSIVAALPSVVSLVWYALHAHEYLTPATCVWFMELVAVLGLCSLVFFLMACSHCGSSCCSMVGAADADTYPCDVEFEALPGHHADHGGQGKSCTQWHMTADGQQVVVV